MLLPTGVLDNVGELRLSLEPGKGILCFELWLCLIIGSKEMGYLLNAGCISHLMKSQYLFIC